MQRLLRRDLRIILGILLLMILLYNSPFYGIQVTYPLYLISIVYFFIRRKRLYQSQKVLLILGLFLVLYGSAYTLIRGVGDFNMFNFSRLFTSIFSSVIITDILMYKASPSPFGMVKWIGVCGVIQAVIVLFAFVNDPFKQFLLQFCGAGSKLTTLAIFRGIGWTFAQFSDFAIAQGLSFLSFIALCLYIRKKTHHSLSLFFYLLLIIYVVTGLLIGRTFQIVIIIGFIFFCFTQARIYSTRSVLYDIKKLAIISAIIMGIVLFFLYDKIPKQTIEWAFEMFINLSESKKIETLSTDELQTMWILPDNISDIIFGLGVFENPNPNGHPTFSLSDAGYVNSIFYWGVLGSILYYLCIFKSYHYVTLTTNNIIIRFMSWSMLALILFYNVKGLGNGFSYACLLLQWNEEIRHRRIQTNMDATPSCITIFSS